MQNQRTSAIAVIVFILSVIVYYYYKDVGFAIAATGLALIGLMTLELN